MIGQPDVIAALNRLLASELATMDHYFTPAEVARNGGGNKLYERIHHEFDDEKGHATALIERILFLEGTPDLTTRDPIHIGVDVPSMLKSDLQLEYDVATALRKVIALCEQHQDYQTREILEKLLDDTEDDHAYWLEKQLRLIDLVGVPNYLQSQL